MDKTFIWTMFFLFLSSFTLAQNKITVLSEPDNSPIKNATILCKEQIIGKTDAQGVLKYKKKCEEITIIAENYYPETVLIEENLKITLTPTQKHTSQIQTVTIEDKSDPKALKILKEVNHRFYQNSPRSLNAFRYKSYQKFSFDIHPDSIDSFKKSIEVFHSSEKPLKNKKENKKNAIKDLSDVLKISQLFLWERAQEILFSKKYGEKTTILDSRISGLKTPIYELLALQSKNKIIPKQILYENRNLYRYFLVDSIIINNRKTYLINYREISLKKTKNNKNYGSIYIDAENFGIVKIANTSKTAKNDFVDIENQYFADKWFPKKQNIRVKIGKLDFSSRLDSLTKKNNSEKIVNEYDGYGFIKINYFDLDSNFQPEAKDFKGYSLSVENDDGSTLSQYRTEPLTERETETYKEIDQIGKQVGLQKKAEILGALLHGKLRYGKVDYDAGSILKYNQYEGLRIGVNAKLNSNFSPYFSPDAYLAYGFKDGGIKYGLGIDAKTTNDKISFFRAELFQDVEAVGRFSENFWDTKTKLSNAGVGIKNNRFFEFFGVKLSYETDFGNAHSIKIAANLQEEKVGFPYFYKNLGNEFDQFSLKLSWHYAPFFKNILTKYGKYTVTKNFPELFINIEQGITQNEKGFNYTRIEALFNHQINTKWGKTGLRFFGGQLKGDAPIQHHFTMNGLSGSGAFRLNLASYLGFATMKGGKYYNDRFIATYISQNIPIYFRTNGRKISSYDVIYRAIIGDMKNPEYHHFNFSKLDKLYQEIGLEWKKIFSSPINFALFCRVGHYNTNKFTDNIALQVKLNLFDF